MVEFIARFLRSLRRFLQFFTDCCRWLFCPPFRFGQIAEHIEKIGLQSVPIVALSVFTTGMILSLQLINIMYIFRAETFAGAAVAIAMSRELAPVVTAIVLIAKNGSAMTAEIGSMKVTEQISAMETMAVSPLRYLVVPRIFASILTFPALTAIANAVGVYGGYFVAAHVMGVNSVAYNHTMFFFVDPDDIWTGLVKAAVFGFIVTVICCYHGLQTSGGAKGVGRRTTAAVVLSTVAILVADYIMTFLFIRFLGM
ncbi:ABC transporter permease [bacterium]|nr:ABC transporter permease [bacterium]